MNHSAGVGKGVRAEWEKPKNHRGGVLRREREREGMKCGTLNKQTPGKKRETPPEKVALSKKKKK